MGTSYSNYIGHDKSIFLIGQNERRVEGFYANKTEDGSYWNVHTSEVRL